MERDSGVTDPAPDLVDADFNAHVARYSDIIVKYRNLNLEVGQRNNQLASKYDRLACFNQELGDDLARFDLEMGNLKHEIHAKTGKFKNLRKELDKLAKVVDKYRRILLEDREFHDSAQQVKRLEGKKRALLRKFRELQGEKIDIESHDVLKSRADLIEHVRCVDEANVEMIWLIELLRHLVDSNVPIQDRRDELKQKTVEKDRQLSKVNGEIAAVSKRIKDLEAALERRRQEKLSPRSETSELADDEMVSHCTWKDDSHITLWCSLNGKKDYYTIEDSMNGIYGKVGEGTPHEDGHPSYNEEHSYLITDTYPDKAEFRRLILYDLSKDYSKILAILYSPVFLHGPRRCDLHPRWHSNMNQIVIDSAHEGFRGLYLIDINGGKKYIC